jgi:hypothetical protein
MQLSVISRRILPRTRSARTSFQFRRTF